MSVLFFFFFFFCCVCRERKEISTFSLEYLKKRFIKCYDVRHSKQFSFCMLIQNKNNFCSLFSSSSNIYFTCDHFHTLHVLMMQSSQLCSVSWQREPFCMNFKILFLFVIKKRLETLFQLIIIAITSFQTRSKFSIKFETIFHYFPSSFISQSLVRGNKKHLCTFH